MRGPQFLPIPRKEAAPKSVGGKNIIVADEVDSVGFVPKLINHVRDRLGAAALPVVLAPSQTLTGLGEFSVSAPDRGASSAGEQAQTAGQSLGGPEEMVANLACW